jgi:hypothetical protein
MQFNVVVASSMVSNYRPRYHLGTFHYETKISISFPADMKVHFFSTHTHLPTYTHPPSPFLPL